jgi:trk system potassium uptake protein TrkH
VNPAPRNRTISRGPDLNLRLILPVVSATVFALAIAMLVCAAVAVAHGDGGGVAFVTTAGVAIPLALAGFALAPRLAERPLRTRDGFLAVTLAWLVAAALGAIPFLLHGTFDRPVDAFFESMSGFTTTGATVLGDIEAEPHSILLWRSLSQWLGGVGIVVLVVAIAPATGLASQRVFYAEMSGVTSDRLTPRIADTAKIITGIYGVFTVAGLAAYALAGMPLFDALNHSLTSVATAGFSTRTASIGAYDSLAIELVAIVLMILGGVNFALYWQLLRDRQRIGPQLPEVRVYLLLMGFGILAATVSLMAGDQRAAFGPALRDGAFAVVSVMTTTGYTTADFDEWTAFAKFVLIALMFVGGCAGSTAGGMKVIRIMLLARSAVQEVQHQLQPTAIQVLRVRGRVFGEDVRRAVLGFFYIYVTVFLVGTLVMGTMGLDPVTAASSVISTLNIVGPGIGEVGATESFASVPQGGLWFLSLLMLIGRLEVFTVLVLLIPAFWRRGVV